MSAMNKSKTIVVVSGGRRHAIPPGVIGIKILNACGRTPDLIISNRPTNAVSPVVEAARLLGIEHVSPPFADGGENCVEHGTHLLMLWDGRSEASKAVLQDARERGLVVTEEVL